VVSACEGYADRLEARREARIKSGRVLSAANLAEIGTVRETLAGLLTRLDGLREKAEPAAAPPPAEPADDVVSASAPEPAAAPEPVAEAAPPPEPAYLPTSEANRLYAHFLTGAGANLVTGSRTP
jgi:hypothetical protein